MTRRSARGDHGDVVIHRATASERASIVALLPDDEIGVGRESPDDLTPYQRAFEVIESRTSCS
jgi:hypothetical protein